MKRRFQLPGVQDLSKEQEEARALPLEGQHLIIGGPGTGKSVVALLRARRLASEKKNYRFLMFNYTLRDASDQLFGDGLSSQQWQQWFLPIFTQVTNVQAPRLPGKPGEDKPPFDWETILSKVKESEPTVLEDKERQLLIVDEGQDMPPQFYQSLTNLYYENFFVVADQNQQIVDGENSTRKDIEDALALQSAEVIELTQNYRNNHNVARLARCFYTGDPASPPPELPPPPKHQLAKPLLFTYGEEDFQPMICRILTMASNNQAKLIGIICRDNDTRIRFYNNLKENLPRFETTINVSTYVSETKNTLRFDEGGIMVINNASCKGLEFDIVFLADIDGYKFEKQDETHVKKQFYVMVSRAIERVFLLKRVGTESPIEQILPNDTEILERQ